MLFHVTLLTTCFILLCSSQSDATLGRRLLERHSRDLSTMAEGFTKHGVVPDVVDSVPPAVIKITYEGGLSVNQGNELTPTQVQNKPNVEYEADSNSFYTLCMTDPDAPSRKEPKFREWMHWLVGNIPGNNITQGETLAGYVGSGPPKDTGLHRYVFVVYKQPSKLTFDEKRLPDNSGDGRAMFAIRKFAKKYNLGEPIAGNLYQAQYDDYVPILYKKLGV